MAPIRLMSLVLLLFAVNSYAASFDCAKASTLIEQSICADAELAKLDDRLVLAYKQALAVQPNGGELKLQQRTWLKNVRNQCRDIACIKKVYVDRITVLKISAENPASIVSPQAERASVLRPTAKGGESSVPLIEKYSESLKIPRDFLSAPLAFQIGGKIPIPLYKFIDAAFKFGKSRPVIEVGENRIIVRLTTYDDLTRKEGRIDYLIVAHEVNSQIWAVIERTVITDSDGVHEFKPHEIESAFAITWIPLIASTNQ